MPLPRSARRLQARRPPWVVVCLLLGAWALWGTGPEAAAADAPLLHLSWFGFLLPIATAVWHLFQAVGQLTLAVLHAAFLAFRTSMIFTARALKSGLWGIGKGVGRFLALFRKLYDRVLRPALQWTWRKLVALEDYLKRSLQPLVDKIREIKDHVNGFYRRFVRPVLDIIDTIRRVDRVLRTFHITLLSRLEGVLSQIESRIEQPFQWLYARLSELEVWVNRIVTFDGYLQRLMLLRSMARDVKFTSTLWWNDFHRDLTPDEMREYLEPLAKTELGEAIRVHRAYVRGEGGPDRARLDEAAADFAIIVRSIRSQG